MNKKRILLVDDHQLVIEGLIKLFESEEDFEVINSANSGDEGLRFARELKPDIVLLDLDLPGLNGISVAEALIKDKTRPKIAILSMHMEKPLAEKLIKLGIDGYFIKNSDREELIQGIRLILNGKKFFASGLTSEIVQPSSKMLTNANYTALLSILSEREKEILKLLAEGYTSVEIGDMLFISKTTVETHRKNLFKKLEVNRTAGLIRFAMKSGLVN